MSVVYNNNNLVLFTYLQVTLVSAGAFIYKVSTEGNIESLYACLGVDSFYACLAWPSYNNEAFFMVSCSPAAQPGSFTWWLSRFSKKKYHMRYLKSQTQKWLTDISFISYCKSNYNTNSESRDMEIGEQGELLKTMLQKV